MKKGCTHQTELADCAKRVIKFDELLDLKLNLGYSLYAPLSLMCSQHMSLQVFIGCLASKPQLRCRVGVCCAVGLMLAWLMGVSALTLQTRMNTMHDC
jgi:hypothetical protein